MGLHAVHLEESAAGRVLFLLQDREQAEISFHHLPVVDLFFFSPVRFPHFFIPRPSAVEVGLSSPTDNLCLCFFLLQVCEKVFSRRLTPPLLAFSSLRVCQ